AFEAYYLEHPEMVQELEATARFKAGLICLKETGELEGLIQTKAGGTRWRYLAAAVAIATLSLGAYFALQREPKTQPLMASNLEALYRPSEHVPEIGGTYTITRTRGRPVDAEVAKPKAGQAIELRVLPEFKANPARYHVRLLEMSADDSSKAVAMLGGL